MPPDLNKASRTDLQVSEDTEKAKKRRLRGACDACRIKKIKCDSSESPINLCTNCKVNKMQCKHDLPRQQKFRNISQDTVDYIKTLQERIHRLEDYIRKVHPDVDIDRIINKPSSDNSPVDSGTSGSTEAAPGAYGAIELSCPNSNDSPVNTKTTATTTQDDIAELEAEDLAYVTLCEDLKKLSTSDTEARYFGQASTVLFVKYVTDLRNRVTGESNTLPDPAKHMRSKYWELEPWELSYVYDLERVYIFPDNDLLMSLVSLYFEKTNSIIPLLHYPTFMKSLWVGQHHWDPSFGMTVLLVCAIGSRYSRDPRVNVTNDSTGLSAGWSYFCQVPFHRKQLLYKSNVYDLQYYALASMYLMGTSMPYACWNVVAIGLRYAYEKGVHRRKGQSRIPTVENELLKRAFWVLVCFDIFNSSFVGRPCSVHETYDVEYPIECDDEYWETDDPEAAFRQLAGKPCSITAFLYCIKLSEILGSALRTLYANKKSKVLSGFIGADWEERMVAELDSSMNKWRDDLPSYLQWDPERQDSTFFHQSVNLHLSYYYVQIQIHRPYLTKKSPLTLPSLAMCNNAARTCSRILDASRERGARVLPNAMSIAYIAGMVITLSLLSSQTTGHLGPKVEIESLQKCVNYLKELENRWHPAGKLCDSLGTASNIRPYEPTLSSQQFAWTSDTPSMPQPWPPGMAHSIGLLNTSLNDNTSSNAESAPTQMVDDWDLQRSLLVEMGYLPEESTNIGSNSILTSAGYEGSYSLDTQGIIPISSAAQSFFPSGNDSYALPSVTLDIASLEEWDRHLAPVGRS